MTALLLITLSGLDCGALTMVSMILLDANIAKGGTDLIPVCYRVLLVVTRSVHKMLMRSVLSDRYRIKQKNSSTTEYECD